MKSWWQVAVSIAFVLGLVVGDQTRARLARKPAAFTTATATTELMQCSDGIHQGGWPAGPDGMCHPRGTETDMIHQPTTIAVALCSIIDDNGLIQPLTANALRQGRP